MATINWKDKKDHWTTLFKDYIKDCIHKKNNLSDLDNIDQALIILGEKSEVETHHHDSRYLPILKAIESNLEIKLQKIKRAFFNLKLEKVDLLDKINKNIIEDKKQITFYKTRQKIDATNELNHIIEEMKYEFNIIDLKAKNDIQMLIQKEQYLFQNTQKQQKDYYTELFNKIDDKINDYNNEIENIKEFLNQQQVIQNIPPDNTSAIIDHNYVQYYLRDKSKLNLINVKKVEYAAFSPYYYNRHTSRAGTFYDSKYDIIPKITFIELPACTFLAIWSFYYNENIEEIKISQCKEIDNRSIARCEKLKKIYSPNLIKILYTKEPFLKHDALAKERFKTCSLFSACPNLQEIVISEDHQNIDKWISNIPSSCIVYNSDKKKKYDKILHKWILV